MGNDSHMMTLERSSRRDVHLTQTRRNPKTHKCLAFWINLETPKSHWKILKLENWLFHMSIFHSWRFCSLQEFNGNAGDKTQVLAPIPNYDSTSRSPAASLLPGPCNYHQLDDKSFLALPHVTSRPLLLVLFHQKKKTLHPSRSKRQPSPAWIPKKQAKGLIC